MGDLKALAASIREVGLLQPLAVRKDGGRFALVAGERRLRAMQLIGMEEAPVHVVNGLDDALKALLAERDENTCRKALTPSEAGALGESPEAAEKKAARARQAAAGPKGSKSAPGNFPQALGDPERTRDKVAAALGMSGKTYEKIQAVRQAAQQNPKRLGRVQERMDWSGKVDPAYREVVRAQAGGRLRERPEAENADADVSDFVAQIDAGRRLDRALADAPVEAIVGSLGHEESRRCADALDALAGRCRDLARAIRAALPEAT
jgi:ParB family chromosome partitioning protein